jgi:hypothetical protein
LSTPEVVQTTARQAAIIHVTVPRSEIRKVMGPGLRELMAAVAAQGVTPAGPWFTYHLRMDPNIFNFEMGLPVEVPVTAAGRMSLGQLPATKVARTECYTVGPETNPDPAAWRTELYRPLIG